MHRAASSLPVLALLAACASAGSPAPAGAARGGQPPGHDPQAACLAAAPEPLAVPGGAPLRLALGAEGVQIYTCAASAGGTGYAWSFLGPEATLLDGRGAPAGQHGAGPSWTLADGSRVVGQKEAAATPDATAIPWLLLRVTAHGGAGRLDGVSWVRRVATSGGLAPATGCDAAAAGAVARVAYRADYCFHGAASP